VERIRLEREARRAKQALHKQQKEEQAERGDEKSELDRIVEEFRTKITKGQKLTPMSDDTRILVCVRKRPLNKQGNCSYGLPPPHNTNDELAEKRDKNFDMISCSTSQIFVHEPKTKVVVHTEQHIASMYFAELALGRLVSVCGYSSLSV
jgi:hypothetical protein